MRFLSKDSSIVFLLGWRWNYLPYSTLEDVLPTAENLSQQRNVHLLKTWPQYFISVAESDPLRRKTVEIRKDDRNFSVGDILVLQEYDTVAGYTGRLLRRLVTHCLRGQPWLPSGYVAMSIAELPAQYDQLY